MSALLAAFLTNPTIIAIVAGVIGALGFGFQQRLAGAKAERLNQQAKEAAGRAQDIRDLEDAARAGAAVHPDDGVQLDPFNRDNR
jgi:hypothetical protein